MKKKMYKPLPLEFVDDRTRIRDTACCTRQYKYYPRSPPSMKPSELAGDMYIVPGVMVMSCTLAREHVTHGARSPKASVRACMMRRSRSMNVMGKCCCCCCCCMYVFMFCRHICSSSFAQSIYCKFGWLRLSRSRRIWRNIVDTLHSS